MSDKRLRCGVIGAGWWASEAHLPAILKHPQADLIAIQKRDAAKRALLQEKFSAKRAYEHYEQLIGDAELDAVIVSSTPNVHYKQAKAALEHGLHVLIEKPMTFTSAEAEELVSIADQKNLHFLISCPWHYTRHGIKAREMIQAGKLGRIRMISVLMTNPVARLIRGLDTSPTHGEEKPLVEPQEGSYSDPEVAGGGQSYTQVSHTAAYLSFLTGTAPESVYARFDKAGSPNDIYDSMLVQMKDGPQVSIASTGATPRHLRNYEVRIFGEKGVLFLELWRGTMEFHGFDGTITEIPPIDESETYPLESPARNLIDTCLGLDENGSPGQLGLYSMQIIEGACRSAESGEVVSIPFS